MEEEKCELLTNDENGCVGGNGDLKKNEGRL